MKINSKQIDSMMQTLKKEYPDATCSLNFETPFQLLVAVMLSAQCTDERVNKTVPPLFAKYRDARDFLSIDLKVLEDFIYPCGFYHTKAQNIIACAKKIVEDFDGKVPQTMEELISLPGVGRKSANVIMLDAFKNPIGIAIDTHAKRISNRIGLSLEKDPLKVEQDLLKIFPKKYLADINHLLVFHGRKICISRKPNCEICPISNICEKNGVTKV